MLYKHDHFSFVYDSASRTFPIVPLGWVIPIFTSLLSLRSGNQRNRKQIFILTMVGEETGRGGGVKAFYISADEEKDRQAFCVIWLQLLFGGFWTYLLAGEYWHTRRQGWMKRMHKRGC